MRYRNQTDFEDSTEFECLKINISGVLRFQNEWDRFRLDFMNNWHVDTAKQSWIVPQKT